MNSTQTCTRKTLQRKRTISILLLRGARSDQDVIIPHCLFSHHKSRKNWPERNCMSSCPFPLNRSNSPPFCDSCCPLRMHLSSQLLMPKLMKNARQIVMLAQPSCNDSNDFYSCIPLIHHFFVITSPFCQAYWTTSRSTKLFLSRHSHGRHGIP